MTGKGSTARLTSTFQHLLPCVVLLCHVFMYQPVLGLLQSDFYQLSSHETHTLDEADDTFDHFVVSPPYAFYGNFFSDVFVSTNGIVSVNKSITEFVPREFPTHDIIIAPFWGDADTRNGAGTITFGETMNTIQLRKVRDQIVAAFPEQGRLFMPLYVFIATWDSVGYFSLKSDLVNTFQCVLTTDGSHSFILFLYPENGLQWSSGTTHGGNTNKPESIAGFNFEDKNKSKTLPGSGTVNVTNLVRTSNVRVPGLWIFRVDESEIIDPQSDPETTTLLPEPETTTVAPEPEPSTATPEPETSTAAPEPETSTAAPEAKTSTAAPEPETTTVTPEPETTTAAPESETSTAAPESETSTAAPESETSTAAPESETSTSAPEPETSTAAPEAKTSTAAPEPETTTVTLEPETTTAAPESETSTAAPESETSTAAPELETSTATPEPTATTSIKSETSAPVVATGAPGSLSSGLIAGVSVAAIVAISSVVIGVGAFFGYVITCQMILEREKEERSRLQAPSSSPLNV